MIADPLERFTISTEHALQQVSQELANDGDRLRERIKNAIASSQVLIGSFSPEVAQEFVAKREQLTEELAVHLKACRTKIREAQKHDLADRKTSKRMLSSIEELDAMLLNERAALARNRVKLEFGILSYPTHARIGEAYLATIEENLPQLSGARVTKQRARDTCDQHQFKTLVRQAYTPTQGTTQYDPPSEGPPMLWCPVTRAWHDVMNTTVAHIVPSRIGGFNAAYIFGVSVEEGRETIWDYKNGLVLHKRIGQALDAAQLVLVPDGESVEGLNVVVLDESLLDKTPFVGGPKYRDLNNSTFQFKTNARPLKRNLYFLCLINLFCRSRLFVDGSDRDQENIEMARVWGSTRGEWMRGSIVRALALEVGNML